MFTLVLLGRTWDIDIWICGHLDLDMLLLGRICYLVELGHCTFVHLHLTILLTY